MMVWARRSMIACAAPRPLGRGQAIELQARLGDQLAGLRAAAGHQGDDPLAEAVVRAGVLRRSRLKGVPFGKGVGGRVGLKVGGVQIGIVDVSHKAKSKSVSRLA